MIGRKKVTVDFFLSKYTSFMKIILKDATDFPSSVKLSKIVVP